jgi:hypothetical protein
MAWFRCFIRGENFPGQRIGETDLIGFYTNRFIEAEDADAAETGVLQQLKTDATLAPPKGYRPRGQARVYFEQIEEVAAAEVPDGPQGFTWFKMEDPE